jgi:toxin ParE1/3/4
MGQVHWAESALDDLKDLLDFVRKDSPAYADRLAVRLTGATRTLASFPKLGSIVPEIQQDAIREIWVRPYRVIYVIRGDDCHVMAIAHASRDLPALFQAEEPPEI